jgi:hypothetical protein
MPHGDTDEKGGHYHAHKEVDMQTVYRRLSDKDLKKLYPWPFLYRSRWWKVTLILVVIFVMVKWVIR